MASTSFVLNTFSYIWRQSAEACIESQAARGYREFEILLTAPHLWPSDADSATRQRLALLLERSRARIAGLNAGGFDYNLASPAQDVRAHGVKYVCGAIDLAADLGAAYVLASPGTGRALLAPPRAQLLGWFHGSMALLMRHAEKRGIRLVVENIPFTFLPLAEDLMSAIEELPEDRIGVAYDVANALYAGEDPLAGLARVSSRMAAIHLSDTSTDAWEHTAVGRGAVPFERLAQATRECGFAGPVVLEIVSRDPDREIDASAAELRRQGW
jgi:L-ribulose-5-phosphate 3-epimerase